MIPWTKIGYGEKSLRGLEPYGKVHVELLSQFHFHEACLCLSDEQDRRTQRPPFLPRVALCTF